MKNLEKPSEITQEDHERLDFILSTLNRKFENTNNSYNGLSTKITYIFSFTAILVGGYITLVYEGKLIFFSNPFSVILNTLGLIGLISTLLSLILASKTRTFLDPPNLDTIYSKSSFSEEFYDLKNQVAADIKACYIIAKTNLESIAKWIDLSLILLLLSIICILLASLFHEYYANIGTWQTTIQNRHHHNLNPFYQAQNQEMRLEKVQ